MPGFPGSTNPCRPNSDEIWAESKLNKAESKYTKTFCETLIQKKSCRIEHIDVMTSILIQRLFFLTLESDHSSVTNLSNTILSGINGSLLSSYVAIHLGILVTVSIKKRAKNQHELFLCHISSLFIGINMMWVNPVTQKYNILLVIWLRFPRNFFSNEKIFIFFSSFNTIYSNSLMSHLYNLQQLGRLADRVNNIIYKICTNVSMLFQERRSKVSYEDQSVTSGHER